MGFEGQDSAGLAQPVGQRLGGTDNDRMPAMHAIEIADRDNAALQSLRRRQGIGIKGETLRLQARVGQNGTIYLGRACANCRARRAPSRRGRGGPQKAAETRAPSCTHEP